jgi:threonine dehydrogenase-like Zn-dependent dehydrogenase
MWVKVRSILSGISDMEEGLILDHDPSAFGVFLSFPFVPGSENVGSVTEAGRDVEGMELGQRVVVDPLLSCRPRQIEAFCPSCSRGEPSCCSNFTKGVVGPGIFTGTCSDTGGGWGDSFIAHRSQLHSIPEEMETDCAMLVPEFARAIKAVLHHPPATGDRVVVTGARSLGLLTVLAMRILGHDGPVLIVAEHPFEVDTARRLTDADVAVSHGPGTAYEEVADFTGGAVRYPRIGRVTLQGGADLVYETTGNRDLVDDALHFVGEGKKLVLIGLKHWYGFDLTPLWFRGVRIHTAGFSGREFYDGAMMEVFCIAMDLAKRHPLPYSDLVTHGFMPAEHQQAFSVLGNRSAHRALKVIFQHVV